MRIPKVVFWGLAVGGLLVWLAGETQERAHLEREVRRLSGEVRDVRHELKVIRAVAEALSVSSAEPGFPEAFAPPALPSSPDSAGVEERLRALETQVMRSNQTQRQWEQDLAGRLQGALGNRTARKEAGLLQAVILDENRVVEERLKALSDLRRSDPEGRTPEVVASMLALAQASPDPRVRADVIRHLKMAQAPELKASLLAWVRSDPDAKVREEAAETLGPLKDDPEVRAYLEHVAGNDGSEKVRGQAKKSLSD